MSLQAFAAVQTWDELPFHLRGLAYEIASFHNYETGLCCPSIRRIAERAGVTDRGVQKGIRALVDLGVIICTPRFIDGRQTSNAYEFVRQSSKRPVPQGRGGGDLQDRDGGDPQFTQNQEGVNRKEGIIDTGTREDQSSRQEDAPPQPKKVRKKPPPSTWSPPASINRGAWDEFEQHRKDIGHPLTDQARQKNANVLLKLSPDEQQSVVDTAIANGWRGLFARSTPHVRTTTADRRHAAAEQIKANARRWIDTEPA